MSRYELFDRRQVELRELTERGHDLRAADCLPLAPPSAPYQHADLPCLVERILAARRADRPVVLMMGAHPIKLGLSRFIIDLIERRVITHLATNGAGLIHDFELASFGGTSEDVARWIRAGQFGLWRETGRLNDLVRQSAARGEGLGEAVGRTLADGAVAPRGTEPGGRRMALRRAHDHSRGHRQRHHPRPSQFRRRGLGPGQRHRFPHLRPQRAAACRGGVHQSGHSRDRAGGLLEGPFDGPQRAPGNEARASAASPRRCSIW